MPERAISIWAHLAVLVVLVALVVGSVAFSFFEASVAWHRGVAVGIAAFQAGLIVLFFMHGLTSPKITWAVVAVAVSWLLGVLFFFTFVDYASRGGFPYVPGH